MRFKKTRNVTRWSTFYHRYLKRRTIRREVGRNTTLKLWVGKQELKATVIIGITIKHPTIEEFRRIYKLIKEHL